MYRDTLHVDLGDGLADIAKAIAKRHDIVAGMGGIGQSVIVLANDILVIAQAVEHLAAKIAKQVSSQPGF